MSYLQVKTVAVLALMFLLQTSVSTSQQDVIIAVRYEKTSLLTIRVIFSEDKFRTFYGCMCSGARNCAAKYSTEKFPNVSVTEVDSSTVQHKIVKPVYRCINSPSQNSLICIQLTESSLPENYILAQTFRLNNPDCQSRYVTLVWLHNDEGLTVYADIPDFEFCDPASGCALTTRRPESSSSTPVSSTTSKKEDKGDDNTGVMAGIAVAIFIVGIGVGIVVVVVVRWKRRKNKRTKKSENEMSNSPSPAPLALSDVTPAADPSTNAISLPSETAEASPREPSSIATASIPQMNYSQIDVSNTDGHAYAALSPSPYYNLTNENSTVSTYEQNTDSSSAYCNTPDATPNSSSAYSVMPTTTTENSNTQRDPTNIISDQPDTDGENIDTPNSTHTYCNMPDATPDSSSAYSAMPTTTTENSNTQRDPTNIVSDQPDTDGENTDTPNSTPIYCNTLDATPNSSSAYSAMPTTITDQPETDDVYEEVNVTNSLGRGDPVNLDASVDGVKKQDDDAVYSNRETAPTSYSDQPETGDVYVEINVTNSPGRGDTVNLDASVDGVKEQDNDAVYSN